jgi:hypothetical protein
MSDAKRVLIDPALPEKEGRTGNLSQRDKARLRREGWTEEMIRLEDEPVFVDVPGNPMPHVGVDFRPEREPSDDDDAEEDE